MNLEKEYKYKISIVMAVYNVEQYIEESIKSIIQQDIGFKQNIQLILVDDGSTDNSGEICRRYVEEYSNNMVYIKKNNGGVSSARNLGLKSVEGKYVNFLDSDDLLSSNTCSIVYDFFEKYYNRIDVVSIPIFFFEGKSGAHPLNYKFKSSRIINVKNSYSCIQLSSSSSFLKTSVFNTRAFDEGLKYGEDAKLLTQVILERFCYGVVVECKYLYRIRKQSKSAIQSSKSVEDWYIHTLQKFHLELIQDILNKYNYMPRYLQYVLMYDIQWRLNTKNNILNEDNNIIYVDLIGRILKYISKDIIYAQKNINLEYKKYALYLKGKEEFGENYSDFIHEICSEHRIETYYKDILIDTLSSANIQIDILKIRDKKLIIEGNIQTLVNEKEFELYILLNERKHYARCLIRNMSDMVDYPLRSKKIEGIWEIDIPLQDICEIKFYLQYKEKSLLLLNPTFGKMAKLVTKFARSYYKIGNFILTKTGKTLIIFKSDMKRTVGREYRYLQELIKKKQYKPMFARMIYFLTKPFFYNKTVWIFMDRADKAGDNAECLFKYVNEKNENIKTYFVISKDVEDYKRIKQLGNVLEYGSYKTKIYYLHAEKVISSQIDENIINPFGGQEHFYRGIMKYDKIFLQHGIIQSDFTKWLNKYSKDINLFITSTEDEYKSILDNDYYYDDSVVKLTGLPRYDYLKNEKQKQIVIMPTWRNSIVAQTNIQTGKRAYKDSFKKSDYFKLWNGVINDERIITLAKNMGYTILFVPHPNIIQQIEDFDKNDYVTFIKEQVNYNMLIRESSLLITDYSSVAFDFVYMKKPIIYYQFDIEEFFNNHTSTKGYFDYKTMGFGPVCYEHENLVDRFIELLNKNCQMEETYKKRVDGFFKFIDTNNCKRVYEEIKKM